MSKTIPFCLRVSPWLILLLILLIDLPSSRANKSITASGAAANVPTLPGSSSILPKTGFDKLLDEKYKCTQKSFTLNCDSLKIVELPLGINFPDSVEHVDFRNNKIVTLGKGIFFSGRKVKALYFANNQIVHLESNVFKNLTSLTHLDLSHNYLVDIPDQTFNGLIQLNTIDLGYNKIRYLSKDVFLQDYDAKFFLKELRLNHNELKELDEDLFSLLFHMDALDLEDNVLETLPDTIFEMNLKLRDLKLSMNHFKQVPSNALRSAKVLEILDLSSNRFKEITYADFEKMFTVTRLRISRCQSLEKISDHAFQDLENLRQLFIEYNRKLREIHSKTFVSNATGEHLNELTEVSLKGNALTTLSPDTLAWSAIQDLDFSDNPWRCDCNLKWIVNLTVNERTDESFMCKQPYKHFNQRIRDMTEGDFTCSFFENDVFIVGAVLLFVLTATGVASIGFLVAKLKIFPKLCSVFTKKDRSTSNNYVRVDPSLSGSDKIYSIGWDRTPRNGRELRNFQLKNPGTSSPEGRPSITFIQTRCHSLETLGESLHEVELFPRLHRTTPV